MNTKNNKLIFFIIILGLFVSFSSNITKALDVNPPGGSAPTIANAFADQITTTSATLNGAVNPNGASTTAWFDISLGSSGFSSGGQSIGSGNNVSVVLTPYILNNLTPNTTYQFRVMAKNSYGTGTGNWISFTTLPSAVSPAPILTSLSPTTGTQGQNNLSVTLVGTGFITGSIVNFTNSGITVNSTAINSTTSITANISIGSNASIGNGNVIVKNNNGISNALSFRVIASSSCLVPTISSISPTSVTIGTASATITIYGSNFSSSTSGKYNGYTKITNFINSNQLDIILNSSDLATLGSGNITVTNGSNYCTSNAVTFFVQSYYRQGGGGNPIYYVSVSTKDARNINENSATLNGLINPNNYPATAWFEYGTSSAFFSPNSTNQISVGSVGYFSPVSQTITNLLPNTTYYFRIAGRNYAGTIKGILLSFTTAKTNSIVVDNTNPNPPIVPKDKNIKADNTPSISNLINQTKTNVSSSFLKWLMILVLILIVGFIFAKIRGRDKHKKD